MQVTEKLKAIWLIKRDFRLHDNEPLFIAASESDEALPVYCFETLVYEGPDWGRFHSYACKSALTALRKNLRHHQSDLYICHGDLLRQLEYLKKVYNFSSIHAHQETGLSHTFARDKALAIWCKSNQVSFIEYKTNGVVRNLRSRDNWEREFKQYIQQPTLPIPGDLALSQSIKDVAKKTAFPTDTSLGIVGFKKKLPHITERNAHKTLNDFLTETGSSYRGGISSMNTAPSRCSRISYDLAWGTMSLRTAIKKTEARRVAVKQLNLEKKWEASLRAFKSRLYWHSHFIQKLETQVEMEFVPQNSIYADTLPVCEGEELARRLYAWKTGTTGFPSIDAAMRYYQKNGWLNFRSRAMIVSFACHALRIPWQVIVYELAVFMMDYVPGIHVPQVQMQAGVTGTNVIRVYSPTKQMTEKDPDAIFIHSQIPELKSFTAKEIFSFEENKLGKYPRPIINFKQETKIMKDVLYGLKKTPKGRVESRRVYQLHGSRSKVRRS
jgi:deoxyribodipyrimidine photo-lyase